MVSGIEQRNKEAINNEKDNGERSANPACHQCLIFVHIAQHSTEICRIDRVVRLPPTSAVNVSVSKKTA